MSLHLVEAEDSVKSETGGVVAISYSRPEIVGFLLLGTEVQHTTIDAYGSAEIQRTEVMPMVGSIPKGTDRGLRMTGVMRRVRVLPKFFECEPGEIQLKDRVVLVDQHEKKIRTGRVKEIRPLESALNNPE